jgi:hypothetical protein
MTTPSTRHTLTFLSRDGRYRQPSIRTGAPLPPRALFKGNKDLLAAYDSYVKLADARNSHMEKATEARVAIPAAVDKYRQAVTVAIAAGEETGTVANPETELIAKAQAHDNLALEAECAATQQGYTLAALISDAAPGLFDAVEQDMEQAATKIRSALASMDAAWLEWSTAWLSRQTLGRSHLYGGELNDFAPVVEPPREVTAARDALSKHLAVLDTLKAEEREVLAFRDEAAHAEMSRAELRAGHESNSILRQRA